MNQTALHVIWHTPDQAKAVLLQVIGPFSRKHWDSGGGALNVVITPIEDARSLRQNRFYFGVVLKEISEQAVLNGIGATKEGWHRFFKRQILGYTFEKVTMPGKKRPSVIKTLCSTKDLSVKKMSDYLEAVQAEAVTVYGVAFSVPKWQEYKG